LQRTTDFVMVVAGPHNQAEIAPVIYANAAFLVLNPHPENGQFSSLQRGLEEVLNRGRDAAILTLVDRPAPQLETLAQLKASFTSSSDQVWAVVPEYSGKHGHPIVIGREMIAAFLRAPATSSARDVEHAHQQNILYKDVDDPLVALNVNTAEDFEKLRPGTTV
jgi:molybdenum cofactor cytidylyltransferase